MTPSIRTCRGYAVLAQDVLDQLSARHAFGWPDETPRRDVDLDACCRHFQLNPGAMGEDLFAGFGLLPRRPPTSGSTPGFATSGRRPTNGRPPRSARASNRLMLIFQVGLCLAGRRLPMSFRSIEPRKPASVDRGRAARGTRHGPCRPCYVLAMAARLRTGLRDGAGDS